MAGIVRHIAHFDLDTFFCSVEILKDSRLKNIPLAVGGSTDRGVIASCTYEARKFGVRSGMSVVAARKLCRELKIIKGDFDAYSKYSRLVTDIIAGDSPVFEKSSIDEFYIDFSGMDKFFGCALYTKELREKIERETGLNISYALSENKLLSKVATNEAKPHGYLEVIYGRGKNFLAPLDIHKLPMIGEVTGRKLYDMGIKKVGSLSQMPVELVVGAFGKNGQEMWNRANGLDESPVVPFRESISVGTENTFEKDTIDIEFMCRELARMTENVAYELRSTNRLAGKVTVKIKYSDHQTFTKQSVIAYSASDKALIVKARELFHKLYDRRLLVRLVGVRLSDLVPGNYQISLFDDTQEMVQLNKAIDSVKKQFGEQLLIRGCGFDPAHSQPKTAKQFRPFKF